ncbi:MAG: heme-binding domain-containing protein [Vicinamibacterales bacterium]
MRVTAGKLIGALAAVFLVAQVIVPARTNPPTDPTKTLKAVRPDAAAAVAVMERACSDCHSNATTWPWYSRIAPVSWLVAHDVNEGRAELNLSEFGTYAPKKQQHKLEEACDAVKEGEMPMWIYTLQHPDAKLQPGDVEAICAAAQPTSAAMH